MTKYINKISNKIKRLKKTIKVVWHEFNEVDCFNRAASLAFVTLLSLVPLLTVSFSVMSAFPTFKQLGIKLQHLLFENFVAISPEIIQNYLQSFIAQTAQLSEIGMIFLVITAVLLVFSMEQTFNAIWRVKRNRKGVIAFLLYWAVITLIPMVTASIVWLANYVIVELTQINLNLSFIEKLIVLCAPYVATFIAFTVLYITLPNCKIRTKNALLAAFVVTILFEIVRKGFAIYIVNFATYKIIYGALAIIPIFLLWLYVSWVVLLLGVVINYVLETDRNQYA